MSSSSRSLFAFPVTNVPRACQVSQRSYIHRRRVVIRRMEEQREIALSEDEEARVPVARPIDKRWDASRVVFMEGMRRSDRTWTPGQGIVFAGEKRDTRNGSQSNAPGAQPLLEGPESGAAYATGNFGISSTSSDLSGLERFSPMSLNDSTSVSRSHAMTPRTRQPSLRTPRSLAGPSPTTQRRTYWANSHAPFWGDQARPDDTHVFMGSESSVAHVSATTSNGSSLQAGYENEHYRPSQDNRHHRISGSESYRDMAAESRESSISLSSDYDGSSSSEIGSDPGLRHSDDDYPTLTWQIPPETYRACVLASQNSMAAFWSHKLYRNEGGDIREDKSQYPPKVLYCRNLDVAEKRAQLFLNEPVLGFDIEWEPFVKKDSDRIKSNVSLIQIAAEDKIGLFHIAKFYGDTAEALMPPSLKKILESPSIIKTGVNVAGDANRVKKYLGLQPRGMFELSHLYRLVQFSEKQPRLVNKKLCSLARQVQTVLGLPLSKGGVRTSSWSGTMQTEQADYAATDAYAGLRVFYELEARRKKMNPRPPRPANWEDGEPIKLGDVGAAQKANTTTGSGANSIEIQPDLETDDQVIENDDGEEQDEFFDAEEDLDIEEVSQSHGSELAHETSSLVLNDFSQDSTEEPSTTKATNDTTPAADPFRIATKRHLPFSAEVLRADSWIKSWRASLPDTYIHAHKAQLRAYHLWHVQNLECAEIAALLGNPPLLVSTVATYIATVLRFEDVPCKRDRTETVLALVPAMSRRKYLTILTRARFTESEGTS